MTVIAPTITTDNPEVYSQRLVEFLTFAPWIHIDIADGEFAPSRTINLNQLYWPPADYRNSKIGLHLMIKRPIDWLDQIVSLAPDKVILHAESDDAHNMLPQIFQHLRQFGIICGLAILPETDPAMVADLINIADVVLIFGGKLGYQGGVADLIQLEKIERIWSVNSDMTIEYDGGANARNIAQIAEAGVDHINVGSAITNAPNAQQAYEELTRLC
ncbi:MAG: hypothetical protein Q4C83_02315 [Candidatus Saccharibacteria bacterium]|nr:hypothetical protein [Candidatus Saccharibacteria bacterium]